MAREFVACDREQLLLMQPSLTDWLPENDLVWTILGAVEEIDRREDELYGEKRGDELPEQLRTPEGRRAALEEAKRRIEERKGRAISEEQTSAEVKVDPELVFGRDKRRGGRREWPRV